MARLHNNKYMAIDQYLDPITVYSEKKEDKKKKVKGLIAYYYFKK